MPHPIFPYYGHGMNVPYSYNNWNKEQPLLVSEVNMSGSVSNSSISNSSYWNKEQPLPVSEVNISGSVSTSSISNSSEQPSLFNISLCLLCTADIPRHNAKQCPMLQEYQSLNFWPSVCHNCRHLIPVHDTRKCPNFKSLHYLEDVTTINNDTPLQNPFNFKHRRLRQLSTKVNSFETACDDSVLGTTFIPEKTRKTFRQKAKNSKEKTQLPPISSFLKPKKGHHEACNDVNCFNEFSLKPQSMLSKRKKRTAQPNLSSLVTKVNSEKDFHLLPTENNVLKPTYTLPNPVLLESNGLSLMNINHFQKYAKEICVEKPTDKPIKPPASTIIIIPNEHSLNPKECIIQVGDEASNWLRKNGQNCYINKRSDSPLSTLVNCQNEGTTNNTVAPEAIDNAHKNNEINSTVTAAPIASVVEYMNSDSEIDVFTSDDEEDALSVMQYSLLTFRPQLASNISECSTFKHSLVKDCNTKSSILPIIKSNKLDAKGSKNLPKLSKFEYKESKNVIDNVITESLLYVGV